MTSKIVVNNIEADAGVSTVFFNSDIGATDGTLNVDGNLTVDGVITYEDVTNVDSVGIITARSGLHVTGGSVGIGNSGDFGFFTNANDRTLILGTGNGSGAIQVHSGGTSYGGLYFGDSTSGNARYSGYVEYKHDENFLRFATAEVERLRITSAGNIGVGGLTTPGALLSIPAGESNTPRLAIESAVDDNDFTITQYEDGNGTYTMLGQNVKLNSGGNTTVLDSGHRTAGILLDARNHGAITFLTGAANAATENVKIDSSGRVLAGLTASVDSNSTLQVEGRNTITAIRYSAATGNAGSKLELSRSASNTVGTTAAVSATDELGEIRFRGASTGSAFNTGAVISAVITSGTISASSFPTDLLFKTTNNGAASATEKLRITSDGKIGINCTPTERFHINGGDGDKFKLDCPNNYSNSSSIIMSQERGEIKTTIDASGGNPGGTMVLRTRNTAGTMIDAITIENSQQVSINSAAGTHPLTVSNGGAQRLRITSDGEVLISNSGNRFLSLDRTNASSGSGEFNLNVESNSQATISYDDGANLVIGTSSSPRTQSGFSEKLSITSTGNMRIGDSSVTFSDNNAYYSNAWSSTDGYNTFLTIASTEYANIRFRGNHSTDAEFTIGVGNGTYYMAYDEIGNTHLLTAIASTGVVSGDLNDTSDEKLKENITSIADGQIDIIKQLRPVNFDWKKGTLKGQSGFIAQEIKAVIPDLVQGEEYDENDFGSVGYSVNTNGLVSHLTKALQEAISKIEALENRLTAAGL